MRVSGKITHSFYSFLRERGFNVSRLFELTSLEMEFLKNPSQWMDIELVESFLKKIDGEYSAHFVDRDFIAVVGRSCFELNAWGELDSVLKMRKKEPVFSHLPMFLSYFIDGLSLIEERTEQGFLSFQSNCSSENYPHVTSYLKAVIESLPLYTDKPRASALWIRNYIQVKWEETNPQTSLFPPSSEENIRPELLSDFRQFLEKIEKELYYNRKRIEEKDKRIRNLKDQLLMQGTSWPNKLRVLFQETEQSIIDLKSLLLLEGVKGGKEGEQSTQGKEGEGQFDISSDLSHKVEELFYRLKQIKDTLNID